MIIKTFILHNFLESEEHVGASDTNKRLKDGCCKWWYIGSLWDICHWLLTAPRKLIIQNLVIHIWQKNELLDPEVKAAKAEKEIYSFQKDADDKDHHSIFWVMVYNGWRWLKKQQHYVKLSRVPFRPHNYLAFPW